MDRLSSGKAELSNSWPVPVDVRFRAWSKRLGLLVGNRTDLRGTHHVFNPSDTWWQKHWGKDTTTYTKRKCMDHDSVLKSLEPGFRFLAPSWPINSSAPGSDCQSSFENPPGSYVWFILFPSRRAILLYNRESAPNCRSVGSK